MSHRLRTTVLKDGERVVSCMEGQISHERAPAQHNGIREVTAVEIELGEKSLEACASRSYKLLFELGVFTNCWARRTDVSRQLMWSAESSLQVANRFQVARGEADNGSITDVRWQCLRGQWQQRSWWKVVGHWTCTQGRPQRISSRFPRTVQENKRNLGWPR